MSFDQIADQFQSLRKTRRANGPAALEQIGQLAQACLRLLESDCELEPIAYRGIGSKTYSVAALSGVRKPFSRPLRDDLFIRSQPEFRNTWTMFVNATSASAGTLRISGISGLDAVRACYTAVMSFAACIDIHRPGNRGAPGTFLEMVIGPAVSVLLAAPEEGAISVTIEGTNDTETIPVDLSFPMENQSTLVIPTKISTRERISQAFVHQRILETAMPGEFRTALVAVNETNVMFPKNTLPDDRLPSVAYVQETLVPGTIALYEKYVASMAGIYYLDPPSRYLDGSQPGLPPVRGLDKLLLNDLPTLVEP